MKQEQIRMIKHFEVVRNLKGMCNKTMGVGWTHYPPIRENNI